MFPMKEQDKIPEEELSKVEIRTDKEFKAIIMQMINELRRRMNEHGKKYITRYKKNQSELKKTTT